MHINCNRFFQIGKLQYNTIKIWAGLFHLTATPPSAYLRSPIVCSDHGLCDNPRSNGQYSTGKWCSLYCGSVSEQSKKQCTGFAIQYQPSISLIQEINHICDCQVKTRLVCTSNSVTSMVHNIC